MLVAAAASADARFAWPYPPKAVSPDEIGHWVVINGDAWPDSAESELSTFADGQTRRGEASPSGGKPNGLKSSPTGQPLCGAQKCSKPFTVCENGDLRMLEINGMNRNAIVVLKTLAKHVAARLRERAFCVVFEDDLERAWPSKAIAPEIRERRIQDFAESQGWSAAIVESGFGTRAVFHRLNSRAVG